jgi:predicted DNA-binding transcriptional regulator AlpA
MLTPLQKIDSSISAILNEDTILNVEHVLTILGISRATYNKWTTDGEWGNTFFTIGKRKFTTAVILKAWVQSRHNSKRAA